MTDTIICYVFSTLALALAAIQEVDTALGIPVSPDAVTQTCCEVDSIPGQGVYFIRYDPMYEGILGTPDTITITVQ